MRFSPVLSDIVRAPSATDGVVPAGREDFREDRADETREFPSGPGLRACVSGVQFSEPKEPPAKGGKVPTVQGAQW